MELGQIQAKKDLPELFGSSLCSRIRLLRVPTWVWSGQCSWVSWGWECPGGRVLLEQIQETSEIWGEGWPEKELGKEKR